jgi:hypothetical protein
MKKRDNQKMNMYAAVLQTCRAQQTIWENISGFVSAVDELESRLAGLYQTHQEQSTITMGVGMSKTAFRQELIDHFYVISKALSLKGLMINDNGLYIRNKTSLSGWKILSSNGMLNKTESVKADLELHSEGLGEYGITSEFIAETQTLIASISEMLFKPRMAVISRKDLTQKVKEQGQRIDWILNQQLDTLILIFKNSVPAFFNKYQSARMIIETSHGTKTPLEPDDGNNDG